MAEPASFERDYGCSEADWLRWLPGAVGEHALRIGSGEARVAIGDGALHLRWHALPPRRIALITLPRLLVAFHFENTKAAPRAAFLRYFDLFMQRGGG